MTVLCAYMTTCSPVQVLAVPVRKDKKIKISLHCELCNHFAATQKASLVGACILSNTLE